jgi:urease accessory protein
MADHPGTALFRLLTFLSPAFPTGGFAYSHALEWAVESGDVTNETTLRNWIADLLQHGAGRTDAILLRLAHASSDLSHLAALATACAPSAERQLETTAMGSAFTAATAPWNIPPLPPRCPYPVAVGATAAATCIAEDDAALGYLQAWSANLVSAGVRLIPLGQSAGLRVLAALEPIALTIADATRACTEADLGTSCFRADIAAMKHETQYTRLFRT